MPIRDLQQRLAEIGRIRMGEQVATSTGKIRPAKLDTWRLTSPSEKAIQVAAEIYGGQPQPWDGGEGDQWQVVTQTNTLDILIPPFEIVSQSFELWSGGGCQRRCDGYVEELSMKPCMCPDDPNERMEQAAKGKACKATTRLRVILPRLPGVGVWRLETHSWNAAVTLAATASMLASLAAQNVTVPAVLRMKPETRKRPGKPPNHFNLPIIDVPNMPVGEFLMAVGSVLQPGVIPAGSLEPGRRMTQRVPLPAGPELPSDPSFVDSPEIEQGLSSVDLPEPSLIPRGDAKRALVSALVDTGLSQDDATTKAAKLWRSHPELETMEIVSAKVVNELLGSVTKFCYGCGGEVEDPVLPSERNEYCASCSAGVATVSDESDDSGRPFE